ncbi:MAG: flagellar biosynthetic protein FliQ [Planctomycetes bacterium]|nr:flagellar biosynthetic protein FliQ [Planctomycetota bacterium]
MTDDLILSVSRRALEVTLIASLPILIVATVVGVITAMLQAVTSIRDMTAGMVIKMAAVGISALIFGGWMLQQIVAFTVEIFNQMHSVVP